MFNTQNYWGSGLYSLSGIQRTRRFGNLFPSSNENEARPLLCPLKTTNTDWSKRLLADPTDYVIPSLSPEDGNRYSFRNFVFFIIPDDGQSPKLSDSQDKRCSLCSLIGLLNTWYRAVTFFSASDAALSQEVPMVKWMSNQPVLWTPDIRVSSLLPYCRQ
jgi:hypothetical protein